MLEGRITICMCTYNGELYIHEQLNSLAAQTLLPGRLVVFDDRSSDRTVDILREFAGHAPFPVEIEINSENLGPALNFSQISRIENAEYVFFCDQDDVWRPEKISTEMASMKALEDRHGADVPLLVHSDLETVDRDLNPIASSFMTSQGYRHAEDPLRVLIVQNFVTGCTVVVNRPAMKIATPVPADAIMHDWWLAVVVAACGHIGFVPEPLIRYRQHDTNKIGARRIGLKNWWSKWRTQPSWSERRLRLHRHTLDTIRQAKALERKLVETGGGNDASLAIVTAYATILEQPFWLRPAWLIRHGINQPVREKFRFALRMALLRETVIEKARQLPLL